MDYTTAALLLIPVVIGYTEGIKDQFPVVRNIVPLIAILVSFIMYAMFRYLPNDLFMTIYGAGAAMGFYTGAKVVGNSNITVNQKS